jgi:predicted ester cyclase/heme-degrading monooxygenase HmoA
MKHKLITAIAAVLYSIAAISQDSNQKSFTKSKTTENMNTSAISKNEGIIYHLYESILNTRKWELLETIISEEYTSQQGTKGANGFKEPLTGLIKALPDVIWTITQTIAQGNKVVVFQKVEGTHNGQFQFVEATGKKVSNDGIAIYEFKDGKIIKAQVQTDRLGFLQQLEVLPHDLSSLKKKPEQNSVYFIDKFTVPAASKDEFMKMMSYNRHFIKALPGFIEDEAYIQTDTAGNLIITTIATWQDEQTLNKAKEAVQAEHKRTNFSPQDFYKRLNIQLERGNYRKLSD